MSGIDVGGQNVGAHEPVYFIADISANHDGDLGRAKDLIHLAAEAGADSAKFQNFRAPKIVSQRGFDTMKDKLSHQAKWKKSVSEVYADASVPWEWTPELKAECDKAGIGYSSTPYDFEAVDMLDPFVPFFKIGSGDITWPEMLIKVAEKNKPVLLACGASDVGEVASAMRTIQAINKKIVLMQCNTNYTGSLENFKHIHLRVLKSFRAMFPHTILGLSCHTPGHTTVLGAVAFGARVIEKHFTDDTSRVGPDHPFSMTPSTWREMVDRTRELELALGIPDKQVAENEKQTVVVQRRCLRAATDLKKGEVITREKIDVLRPAPVEAIFPYNINKVIGMRLSEDMVSGDYFTWGHLESNG